MCVSRSMMSPNALFSDSLLGFRAGAVRDERSLFEAAWKPRGADSPAGHTTGQVSQALSCRERLHEGYPSPSQRSVGWSSVQGKELAPPRPQLTLTYETHLVPTHAAFGFS